jgi:hypothetical protein
MKEMFKPIIYTAAGLFIVLGLLYVAGYQVKIVSRADQKIAQSGLGKQEPGWRRAQGQAVSPEAGSGQGSEQAARVPGSGQGRKQQMAGGPAGSGQGGRGGGGGGGRGQQAQAGQQPGFGPSGGILLPMQMGTQAIPVLVNGKEVGSFVGKDLMDKVEDTVIATAEGPRKGWGVGKTLAYLGVKGAKEVVLFDKSGKKITVSGSQLQDQKTFVLLTYDATGSLLLVSGPKVRGTNKGMTPREQVIQMVAGRKDLLNFSNIVRLEVIGG